MVYNESLSATKGNYKLHSELFLPTQLLARDFATYPIDWFDTGLVIFQKRDSCYLIPFYLGAASCAASTMSSSLACLFGLLS